MFKLLSSYKSKRIVVELANGKQLAGTVIEVRPAGYAPGNRSGNLCHSYFSNRGSLGKDEPFACMTSSMADQKNKHPNLNKSVL